MFLTLAVASIGEAKPKIMGETVEYSVQGVVMKGYLAYDEHIQGKRPGVPGKHHNRIVS